MCCSLLVPFGLSAKSDDNAVTDKHFRQNIREGNKAYREGNYTKAEEFYKAALTDKPSSELAEFNLALTLVNIAGPESRGKSTGATQDQKPDPNDPWEQAREKLTQLSTSSNKELAQKAFYNLGNLSFYDKDYKQSIEFYKSSLRLNPADDKARQNLRVAQLKLRDEQNNGGGQDQQQQQQNQQNQQQNQDQQNQNQNQNNQNNNQNQDKKDQDQNKDKQQQGDGQQQKNQNPTQKQGTSGQNNGISKENAEKILEAMDRKEAQTREKVEKAKKQKAERGTNPTTKPW